MTKPKMARAMIEATLEAGVPCAYIVGDSVYGADSSLRCMLEARHQPYVLVVRGAHAMRRGGARGFEGTWPEELASELTPADWVCHAAGEGSKGPRLYDWARIRRPWTSDQGFGFWPAANARNLRRRPTTWSLPPRRSPTSPPWRVCAGRSRNASSAPRTTSAWITARPAPGTAGIAI